MVSLEGRVIWSRNVGFDENFMINYVDRSIVLSDVNSVDKQVEQQVTQDKSELQCDDQRLRSESNL